MEGPCDFKDLNIIGYGTVLKDTMVPSVVPAIFQLKSNPEVILLPPYHFFERCVWNATRRTTRELNKLVTEQEITLISTPFPAQPEFEMWVDDSMQVHYEPRVKAEDTLHSIALASLEKARRAFAEENYIEADRLCSIALSADDRISDSLIIKAAIFHRKGDRSSIRVMEKLAAKNLTPTAFQELLQAFLSANGTNRHNGSEIVCYSEHSDLLLMRPMFRIAALKTVA